MLFFRQIVDEKFKKPGFRKLYEKECHICSTTLKVIAELEDKEASVPDILEALHISIEAYQDLKDGENCNPELVRQLCRSLGFNESGLFKHCQRLK